ncbi:MAG: FAD-binding protein [Paramuribaculum sp.]|nr:FAD-binding protein [Paramuribaculum sp.]
MIKELQLSVSPDIAYDDDNLRQYISKTLHITPKDITGVSVIRRSIDARQRQIKVNLVVKVYINEQPEKHPLATPIDYPALPTDAPQCIIVGAGPGGLFAALRLIELGVKPIVLERGKDVDSRRKDLAEIARSGKVDSDSNYCFGEGGAGTYSDGKLFTRSKKRGPVDKILTILYQHGAQHNILIETHPHIGTDRLPEVIKAIRNTILSKGGEIHFNTRVTDIIVDNFEAKGVITTDGTEYLGPVILATGHSARDIYNLLVTKNIKLDAKGIAVGVRLEHPQQLIDQIRYHRPEGRGKYLPAAEYSMLTRVDNRAVYSFCMCPGGVVVPAASAPEEMVVNGMSSSARGSRWANSAMVVEILPEDIPGDSPLRMMEFQKEIEKRFYEDSSTLTQNAPAQRMTDFVKSKLSKDLPATSYAPGIHSARIDELLPQFISTRLQKGFQEFDYKNHGFLSNDAILIGNETRTSSPVRIPRDKDSLNHLEIKNLFPCGEGAGYAGGIVSAAIDGDRCATAAAQQLLSH